MFYLSYILQFHLDVFIFYCASTVFISLKNGMEKYCMLTSTVIWVGHKINLMEKQVLACHLNVATQFSLHDSFCGMLTYHSAMHFGRN